GCRRWQGGRRGQGALGRQGDGRLREGAARCGGEGNGYSATGRPKRGRAMTLKKGDGKWTIDWAQSADMPPKEEMAKMGRMFDAISKASSETATDIKAGKFNSVDDAKKAMEQKMMAAVMGNMPKPPGGGEGGLKIPAPPGGAGQ